MKIEDVCKYLQVPEKWIRSKIRQNTIPFHDSHGILRFNQQEIDDWMRVPSPPAAVHGSAQVADEGRDTKIAINDRIASDLYVYRGTPIKEYLLTASVILTGHSSWMRLPDFIERSVGKTKELNRPYLFREEFKPLIRNYNDYLRVCCWLGVFDKKDRMEYDLRRKYYIPNQYAGKIAKEDGIEGAKSIIIDSILNIVTSNKETIPEERCAILLLWLCLKIKTSGKKPQERDFFKDTDKRGNSFPRIRLNCAASLCHFLFDGDTKKEREFLSKWEQHM
ncbi:MAG TPA: helix-turn-helix domain-containing protein [Syntrophobacteraceae bacterium]|nr:helix-turn-helix domain-containing protein [Syntrophobacteraceae bacterium]